MDKNKGLRSCLLIVGVLLFLGILLLFGYRFLAMRVAVNTPPPQILIHKPYNHAEVSLEQGAFIHSTANSEKGINRIELWIDGEFIAAEDAPANGAITPMVLHAYWQPAAIGIHEVIVRAYDTEQREGIGSILLTAIQTGEADIVGYDPLEDESGDAQVSDASGPVPAFPGGSGEGGVYNPPGGAPPPAEEAPPAPTSEILEFTFWGIFELFSTEEEEESVPESGDSYLLKLEALGLDTGTGYEGVHCYFGLGDQVPAWYPDTDNNQATDENFPAIGHGQWDVASFLSEGSGIIVPWSGSEPINFSISCIGTAGGGTQAVDLGRVERSIPASDWDGVTRMVEAAAEGSFRLSYRITREDLATKELDPTIPVPYNLRIDERRQELVWDWDTGEEGEGARVTGFMVYINDILVFGVPGLTSRAVRIPYTWLSPPCRTEYTFTVRAHKFPYPDGDYSSPSEPLIYPDPADPPRTDCQPEFLVEFHTLETGGLPGDDASPTIGPIPWYL